MKCGCDIDGVLASFESGYAPILTRISGIEFPDIDNPEWPATWDWDLDAGATKEQVSRAWDEIKASGSFWYDLYALPNMGYLRYLPDCDLYFITARLGKDVKAQTEQWLERYGVRSPTVLICKYKGLAAAALDLDIYIEDKWENAVDVATQSKAKVFLIDRPYNRNHDKEECDLGIVRVKNLKDVVDWLT